MSFITREIRAAWDRLRFWAFPRAVRRYVIPKPKARIFRYPSPGSEPADRESTYIDYKTAYRDSTHNVRYNVELHPLVQGAMFIADPLGETTTEKLVRYGYLKQKDMQNAQAVEEAKKQYEAAMGEPVETKVHHDDFGIGDQLIAKNHESVGEFVSNIFEGVRQANAAEAWLNDLDEVYRAQFYYLKSFDFATDDPAYRQLIIELEGQLMDIANNRTEIKDFPVFKGDPGYWRILDDSFSEDTVKLVQSSVKNYTGLNDYAPVKAGEWEIPPEKPQPTVQHPVQNKFVQ